MINLKIKRTRSRSLGRSWDSQCVTIMLIMLPTQVKNLLNPLDQIINNYKINSLDVLIKYLITRIKEIQTHIHRENYLIKLPMT